MINRKNSKIYRFLALYTHSLYTLKTINQENSKIYRFLGKSRFSVLSWIPHNTHYCHSVTRNFFCWSTMMAEIFEDFEAPFKNLLAAPLVVII